MIVLVGIAGLAGFAYFRYSGIFRHGPEVVEQIFTLVDEIDDLEELAEIEELEDLEDLEGIEDIEEIEFLQELEDEDIEEIANIGPIVRSIYESIPEGITDMFQEETDEEPAETTEDVEDEDPEITVEELLPNSISIHPDMNVVSYRDFEEVPDIFWQEFEEDYINENTVVLTYETDFPERKIAELRELEEVPEDITDEMVEEERDNLTRLYNIKAIAGWHRENLTAEGWETLDTDRNLEDNLSYQHNREGYFIIAPPENLIYTPQN